ncbi:hypothetical protein ACI2JA_03145 [Alkalihalobacillus sp. NPDC078783]
MKLTIEKEYIRHGVVYQYVSVTVDSVFLTAFRKSTEKDYWASIDSDEFYQE